MKQSKPKFKNGQSVIYHKLLFQVVDSFRDDSVSPGWCYNLDNSAALSIPESELKPNGLKSFLGIQ